MNLLGAATENSQIIDGSSIYGTIRDKEY